MTGIRNQHFILRSGTKVCDLKLSLAGFTLVSLMPIRSFYLSVSCKLHLFKMNLKLLEGCLVDINSRPVNSFSL